MVIGAARVAVSSTHSRTMSLGAPGGVATVLRPLNSLFSCNSAFQVASIRVCSSSAPASMRRPLMGSSDQRTPLPPDPVAPLFMVPIPGRVMLSTNLPAEVAQRSSVPSTPMPFTVTCRRM